MRFNFFPLVFSAVVCLSAGQLHAGLLVTTTDQASTLIGDILGAGITLVGTGTYIGAATQSATFSGGLSSGLGFDSGILLTTGDANLAPGPNDQSGAGAETNTGTDADLNALIGVADGTLDKAVLQFNFQFGDGSKGGDLFFTYQFASEEYNEFVNSEFNDVFALFVDGVNVAIAPNGSAVSINNVNCGNPFSGTGPNCSSFNNNEGGAFNLQYDGFTDAFVAKAVGLSAGSHTMKFAIADVSDQILDSGVFIEAGSFASQPPVVEPPPTQVPEPDALTLMGLGLGVIGLLGRGRIGTPA
jgi:hypothetical protein